MCNQNCPSEMAVVPVLSPRSVVAQYFTMVGDLEKGRVKELLNRCLCTLEGRIKRSL